MLFGNTSVAMGLVHARPDTSHLASRSRRASLERSADADADGSGRGRCREAEASPITALTSYGRAAEVCLSAAGGLAARASRDRG
jgi:hypothetical protein